MATNTMVNDPGKFKYWTDSFKNITRFNKPWQHAAIMGGLGLGAGYLLRPVVRRFRPDIKSEYLPYAMAGAAGLGSGAISNFMNKKSADNFNMKAPMHPDLVNPALAILRQVDHIPMSTAMAMAKASILARQNNETPFSTVNSAAARAGLDQGQRFGWAAAGLGATMIGAAPRPAMSLLSAGLNLAGR